VLCIILHKDTIFPYSVFLSCVNLFFFDRVKHFSSFFFFPSSFVATFSPVPSPTNSLLFFFFLFTLLFFAYPSIQNQNILTSNLQKIKLSKVQNSNEKPFSTSVYESSTEVLLFLKNLETLRIPWSKFPNVAQIEVLKYAQECYVSDTSMNEMASKGTVRKYVRSNDRQYGNENKKTDNDDKNRIVNNNDDYKKFNQINEKKVVINSNNKKPLLLSHGLDLLSVISNLGCKWIDITSLSSITANYLIQNSCEIIIKSRTRVSTKSNPTNYEYSVGVIERNDRLLKYGRTFIRTYDDLHTNFEDFDVVTEDVVLESFSIVLEGLINDVIMKESSHDYDYDYDYDWGNDKNDNNDVMISKNIHNNVRNNNNDENDRNLEEGSIDDHDNDHEDDNSNNNNEDDGDVKNNESISNSGMSNYNIIHAEFELLEKMEMKSNTELPHNTEIVSNPLLSVEKKQADDDFFTEIENISKFSRKVKKTPVSDKSKISKNIVLNEIKRPPGDMVEKMGMLSTPSSSSPISSSSFSSSTSSSSSSSLSASSSQSSSSSSTTSSSSSSSPSSASTTTKVPPPTVPIKTSHSNDDVFDLKKVLSILQSSGLKWQRISSKNKIEFSILISELLLKITDTNYHSISNISKDLNTSTTQAKAENSNSINNSNLKVRNQKRNEEIQSYINTNKKYFYYLNIRIQFLSFLNNCGIDKFSVSPQLRNNILLIKDDVRTSLDDILSLQSSHPMIISLRQYLEKYSKL
jgi:hypothetical protein